MNVDELNRMTSEQKKMMVSASIDARMNSLDGNRLTFEAYTRITTEKAHEILKISSDMKQLIPYRADSNVDNQIRANYERLLLLFSEIVGEPFDRYMVTP